MLSEEDRQLWREIGCATACDAMEQLSMRRAVICGMKFLVPGEMMVGTAYTVRQLAKHGSAGKSDRLVRHAEVAAKLAQPGNVVVVDVGGITDVASWGEIHSRRCMKRGVAGLVINGSVRDAGKIRAMKFPVSCMSHSPVKSQWDLETAAINEPVSFGGVQIRPGDLILADDDGVVVIPQENAAAVQALAHKIMLEEADL